MSTSHRRPKKFRYDWLTYAIIGIVGLGSALIFTLATVIGTPPTAGSPPPSAPVSALFLPPITSAPKPAPAPQTAAERVYTVQRGDNLWSVAQKTLGAGKDWPQLYTLNRKTIGGNPDVIHPGEKLKL